MKKVKVIILSVVFIMIYLINPIYANSTVEGTKIVYLTFDDGPSESNTLKILDVLNESGVKASFFVVGGNVKKFPEVVKKVDRDKMAIFPHCNNHTYEELYSTKEYYFNDLVTCNNIINNVIGRERRINFVRMPGGSDNLAGSAKVLASIRSEMPNRGISYIDWNIDSGDTSAIRVSTDNIKNNINKFAGSYKIEVLLMHDLENKDTTTQALKEVIEEYKAMGYTFKTLDEIQPWELDYLKKIKVINR